MRINELDKVTIGNKLINLPLSALLGGNDNIAGIANFYTDKSEPNAEFISDILNLTKSEIIDKWYGGEQVAQNMIM